ncbi:MAG: alpha/beta hydrolase [Gammaproteobacteria bacterium]|nr:alpha/beta hydrolase [Gammaproteobacteria bacterium]
MAAKMRKAATAVSLRRTYVDCRYGQLHLATAFPPSGGFDERTALLYLHDEDGTGADFKACATLLGTDRSVYAPDLPGSGASDAPAGRPTISNCAAAAADLLDQLRLREVDVIGCGRGALVAFELAAMRPREIRRLLYVGKQQPAATPSQPLLHLDEDCATLTREPVGLQVAKIREFLDA